MFLDSTSKSLEVRLEGAASVQFDVVASYVDITENTFTPGSTDMVTNDSSYVTAIPAPTAGVRRQVKEVTLCNPDTDLHTAYIYLNNSGTRRLVLQEELAQGATLTYRPDALRGPPGTDGASGIPAGAVGTPADFGVFFQGKPQDSQELLLMPITRAIELPSLLSGSYFLARIAPTADYTITIYQNGGSVGTILFSAAGTIGAATFAGAIILNVNDTFELVGQSAHDTTLQDVSFAFAATFA